MADNEKPADEKMPRPRVPLSMRPRSTPNAEINAQVRDQVKRDMGIGYPLAPNQAFKKGGKVNPFANGGPEMGRSPSLDHRNLFKR